MKATANSVTATGALRAGTFRARKFFACLPLAVAALAIGHSTPALANPTVAFDPALSLTGDCSVSTLDPVFDPGCPGGAHPPRPFKENFGIAIDAFGNRYVSNVGKSGAGEGRIDIFNAEGEFLHEIASPVTPLGLAVDSKGNLYVGRFGSFVRYPPTKYEPEEGEIEYGEPVPVLPSSGEFGSILINPQNDHVFRLQAAGVAEYSSAVEGNELIDHGSDPGIQRIGEGEVHEPRWMAIDFTRERIYVSSYLEETSGGNNENPKVIKVFDLKAPHSLLTVIDGSTVPGERFLSDVYNLSVAVEEESGHVFVGELGIAAVKIYELEEDGSYVATISRTGMQQAVGEMEVDNGPESPTRGYLFVPSGAGEPGHSLAFERKLVKPPVIESLLADGVSEDEAVLRAKINPQSEATEYRIEYTSEQSFQEEGFSGALVAEEGTLAAEPEGVWVAAGLAGLEPHTAYRFRVHAESEGGEADAEASFATYRAPDRSSGCPNEALRSGLSVALPDCRAYELVTPANTNGRVPRQPASLGDTFGMRLVSPDGERTSFRIEGGAIPGHEAAGNYQGDPYLTTRGPQGWETQSAGPAGYESSFPLPGSFSPDQLHSFWTAGGEGSALIEGKETHYVRYPDGRSELVGRGSLGVDPEAEGRLIRENGAHIIFKSNQQLEPNAPPTGTAAVYDRTGDEVTHVVSLLPEELTPAAGQHAGPEGASLDGKGVAFKLGGTLYLRYENEETFEIGSGLTFAGVAEGGNRIFYMEAGKLRRFDALSGETIDFNGAGTVTPVNVSADGSAAYLVSESILTAEANPNGEEAEAGEQNLYLSKEGEIGFIGVVTDRDVEGRLSGGDRVEGLGLWLTAVGSPTGRVGRFGIDPSRTTPDGGILLFESRANLAGYDSEGKAQIYRYDATAETLRCLSCNPTLAEAAGDASLMSFGGRGDPEPLDTSSVPGNLTPDGSRAFFQSPEPLVAEDRDGLLDVYEWEEEGVGSCATPEGCIYLISSGQSAEPEYLYGVSDSGDDVFFLTNDLLNPSLDADETASIYDARVGGGFPTQAVAGECLGGACQPSLSPPDPPVQALKGAGNVSSSPARKRCPKGKRRIRKRGQIRCVATPRQRHRKRHRHTQAADNRRTHR